jgi:hypothetical protein
MSLPAPARSKQGHYALDPKALAEYPPADIELAEIGEQRPWIGCKQCVSLLFQDGCVPQAPHGGPFPES